MSDWISVNDRLPENSEDGNEFLIFNYGSVGCGFYSSFPSSSDGWGERCTGKCFYVRNSDTDYGGLFKANNVTHWMPLPKPPTEQADHSDSD